MPARLLALWVATIGACLAATAFPERASAQLDVNNNAVCLGCHSNPAFAALEVDGRVRSFHVNTETFNASVHGKMQFTCVTCHSTISQVPHKKPAMSRAEWRRSIPDLCGNCHAKQRAAYEKSVHGDEVIWKNNSRAAICSDCHRPHELTRPATESAKIAITENCGNCHADSYRSYTQTYHGKVHRLGYAYTAKCFNCHGSHDIQRTHDPASAVHPDNRLKTCQQCHADATAGFVTFQPHANTHDYSRYPYMWITAKFMMVLIIGVFIFFWTHCALWFYREYRDRKEGKSRPHVLTDAKPEWRGKHFKRFNALWRWAHLLFALALMVLSLTGMAVFYAETKWARAVMADLGGPQVAAAVHRVAAVLILSIFLAQLIYFIVHLAPRWRTFKWFGHTSLVPGLQDFKDIIAMFKWFFGKGPRPVFGRWTYWERFDYWAPFWGLTIVGGSGLMLWFKEATAAVWPGWIFNIAQLAHGEEAFLAIVFLFTVHFFNNHFRPDKMPPPDIVMFTGTMSLEEFAREHTIEYQELVRTGQLEKHLVNAPSRPMTLGSRILGIVLLLFGLTLLVLVLSGFVGELRAGA